MGKMFLYSNNGISSNYAKHVVCFFELARNGNE